MARIVTARAITLCPICTKHINIGESTSHRPGFGWVHHPLCVTRNPVAPAAGALGGVKDSANKWDDLEDDEEGDEDTKPEPDTNAKVRKELGLPAQKSEATANTDAIEAKLFDEMKRALADQNRLVKSMVKGELRTAFDETLPDLLKQITGSVKAATTELVAAKLEEARKDFKTETARAIARIANSGVVRQEITIVRPDGERSELKGEVFHEDFSWICDLAAAGKPIFLPGPTGCGKTHLASQLARALFGDKWQSKFGVISCSPATSERHFLGRSIPNITTGSELYRAAEFVNVYENGGVFCADEIDAGDASVFLVLNAALANGFLPLPDRTDKPIAHRHPDFVFVACANTWGRGADRRYVGRNALDEATLDRFRIGTVPLDYSPAIERAKCPDTDLFDTLTHWRKKIFDERLERVLSTRYFGDAYDMLKRGAPMHRIKKSFFSGWRADEVRKVLGRTLEEEVG
jgi:DNA polymerase III delta prime subunit